MEQFSDILINKADGVMQIILNRSAKKNALTSDMYDAMTEALVSATTDDEIKAVLINGVDNVFSAGADLKGFDTRKSDESSPAFKFLKVISVFPKPIVAAVSGIAVGIGATVLLHCDLVYASPTKFRMPFVNIGICPEAASSLLLPYIAGHRLAAEILMLGEFFDTKKAIEVGLVNAECPQDEVIDFALTKAKELAQKPSKSMQITKQLMKKKDQTLVAEQMEEEFQHFGPLLLSEESISARDALKNKLKK